jgi:hypothetical protein
VADERKGYPRLAARLAIDAESGMYRRFSYLQARLLLEKQDDLRLKEQELEILDAMVEQDHPDFFQSRQSSYDPHATEQLKNFVERHQSRSEGI